MKGGVTYSCWLCWCPTPRGPVRLNNCSHMCPYYWGRVHHFSEGCLYYQGGGIPCPLHRTRFSGNRYTCGRDPVLSPGIHLQRRSRIVLDTHFSVKVCIVCDNFRWGLEVWQHKTIYRFLLGVIFVWAWRCMSAQFYDGQVCNRFRLHAE